MNDSFQAVKPMKYSGLKNQVEYFKNCGHNLISESDFNPDSMPVICCSWKSPNRLHVFCPANRTLQ